MSTYEANEAPDLDLEKLKIGGQKVFGLLTGAAVSAMIYLGDRLGLYRALQDTGAVTSDGLAENTGLSERWLREWLRGQGAAGLLEYMGEGRFRISPEMAMILADEDSPKFAAGIFGDLPQRMAVLEKIPDAFKTGMGLPYDERGSEGARGIERVFGPWYRHYLLPVVLPALTGVEEKMRDGAKVADVGCGAGAALVRMAGAYPQAEFHGYEISQHALERARENITDAEVGNLFIHDAKKDALPEDGSFDFITTFDCIHDMTRPAEMIQSIRSALKPNGTWLIADIKSAPTYEENLNKPMTSLMYAFSVMGCMSSALSEPGGAGLGTLGFNEEVARKMTREAGFSKFKRHDFENPINAYYEVRP